MKECTVFSTCFQERRLLPFGTDHDRSVRSIHQSLLCDACLQRSRALSMPLTHAGHDKEETSSVRLGPTEIRAATFSVVSVAASCCRWSPWTPFFLVFWVDWNNQPAIFIEFHCSFDIWEKNLSLFCSWLVSVPYGYSGRSAVEYYGSSLLLSNEQTIHQHYHSISHDNIKTTDMVTS